MYLVCEDINTSSIYNISVLDGVVNLLDTNGNKRTFNVLTSNGHGVQVKNEGNGSAILYFHNTTTYTRVSLVTNATDIVDVKVHLI